MNISVSPIPRFLELEDLRQELEKIPSNEQYIADDSNPIQVGADFESIQQKLKFGEEECNFIFLEGWINERPDDLDDEAFKVFIENLRAPFDAYETMVQLWPTAYDGSQGATFLKLLAYLGDGKAIQLKDALVKAFKDQMGDGAIRIESFLTPRRRLTGKSVTEQRILVPSKDYNTWKQFLKEPSKQFVEGYSAMSAALVWETGKARPTGFPEKIENALVQGGLARQGIKLLLAQPERKTPLKGGGYPSHTDVFCLARNGIGELLSIAIEAKVEESFGPYIKDWIEEGKINSDGGTNRQQRLNFLCDILGIKVEAAMPLRYQLFHRTVAPILEAREFNCQHAVMLVHSFSQQNPQTSFDDYKEFVGAMLPDETIEPDKIYGLPSEQTGMEVWIGWVQDDLPKEPKL